MLLPQQMAANLQGLLLERLGLGKLALRQIDVRKTAHRRESIRILGAQGAPLDTQTPAKEHLGLAVFALEVNGTP